MARDIGDEQALARQDEQPRHRRPSRWLIAFMVLVAVVGGLNAVRNKGGGRVAITRSCSTPALALRAGPVVAGGDLDWSATGPSGDRYTLVADGTPTGADGHRKVRVRGGSALTPLFPMVDCLVHSTLVAPKRTGEHTLRLFERTGSRFRLVASRSVTVR